MKLIIKIQRRHNPELGHRGTYRPEASEEEILTQTGIRISKN